jgi:integrase
VPFSVPYLPPFRDVSSLEMLFFQTMRFHDFIFLSTPDLTRYIMTTTSHSLSILGPTLSDALHALESKSLHPTRLRDLRSAINTFSRVVDLPPSSIPIRPDSIRRLMDKACPGTEGLSKERWLNVKSGVRSAIKLSGLANTVALMELPISDQWLKLALLGATNTERSILRRLGRYCTHINKPPELVDDLTFANYGTFLADNQFTKSPKRSVKDAVRFWNRHAGNDPSGQYAKIDPKHETTHHYTLKWNQLPASLYEDAQIFKQKTLSDKIVRSRLGGLSAKPKKTNPLRKKAHVTHATAEQRDRMIRRLASVQILEGVPACELLSLSDLVDPDNVELALNFFIERNGGKQSTQSYDMAYLALVIARHHCKLSAEDLDALEEMANMLRQKKSGMTEKNKRRLAPFKYPKMRQKLLELPFILFERAKKKVMGHPSASIAQTAVAIAILIYAPMRLQNLRTLDRSVHFIKHYTDVGDTHQIIIPEDEVKNEQCLVFPVPVRLMRLINQYMEIYQPHLTSAHTSPLLFPGRTGKAQVDSCLRRKITHTIKAELGVDVNPHLFRHLAAFMILERNPGHYETCRLLLGHKNLQTTINFYSGAEQDEAVASYHELLETKYDGSERALDKQSIQRLKNLTMRRYR